MDEIPIFTSAKNADLIAFVTAVPKYVNAVIQWKVSNLTIQFQCDCKWQGQLRIARHDARGHIQCPQCLKHFFIGPCLRVTGPVQPKDYHELYIPLSVESGP